MCTKVLVELVLAFFCLEVSVSVAKKWYWCITTTNKALQKQAVQKATVPLIGRNSMPQVEWAS